MNNNFKKNAMWNTLGITFNAFNSLFFLVIINRLNGIEEAGIFSFAFSIACLFYIIGIYSGRTFQISDSNNELTDREYLVHKFITCGIMMSITLVFVIIQPYSTFKSMVIIALCLYKCLEAFSDTLYGYLQKNNELHIVGKSLFLKSVIGIIIFLITDYLTHDILISCILLMLNSLFFVLFYDLKATRNMIEKSIVNFSNVLKLFKIGFSVFAFSFFAVYIVNVPKYVIDVVLTDEFQTIFSIIIMPGTIMSLCGQYIMHPLLNDLVGCYNKKKYIEFKNIILKITKILIVMAIFVEIGAALLGIPVLNIIYAIDISDYKLDLLLIIFGAVLYALAGVVSTALITMRKNNMQLVIYIIDAVFGLLVSYLLINNIGIHGATIAYALTMMLHAIMYVIYFLFEYKKLNIM